jgi:hypothetical protein
MVEDNDPNVLDQAQRIPQGTLSLGRSQAPEIQGWSGGEYRRWSPVDDAIHRGVVEELDIGCVHEHLCTALDPSQHNGAERALRTAVGNRTREGDRSVRTALRTNNPIAEARREIGPTLSHIGGEIVSGLAPTAQTPTAVRQVIHGELVGICVRKGYVIAVEMADDDIGRFANRANDARADRPPDCDLQGMGKQSMAHITQGYPGVD